MDISRVMVSFYCLLSFEIKRSWERVLSDDEGRSGRIIRLDFVKRNDINGLHEIFEFADFFFEKIRADLNGRSIALARTKDTTVHTAHLVIFHDAKDL